ncbi:TcpE family conjugal transfer membrane protein [Nonomuraea sp. NPDC004297]
MDLPTYTNIWRIEKRLYKLYDLRLPMPLPIVWIGVFVGVFVPWSLLLVLVGVPVEMPWHVLFLVPPGIVTWLSTRPVIEGKRLTELLESQLRYLGQPKAWYRLAPSPEPETVTFSGRVWRTGPARVKSKGPGKVRVRQRKREGQRIAGPRQVRPAVAAAAAAATQAPVAEPPARTGWGTRRRGAAPALRSHVRQGAAAPAPTTGVAPVWREEGASGGAGRRPERALLDEVVGATRAAVPAESREPVDAAGPVPAGDVHDSPERGDERWVSAVAHAEMGAAMGAEALAAHEAGVPIKTAESRKPAAGKPIDTEALRRLRRLAASAGAPADTGERAETGTRRPPARHQDDAARDQHRKGQPPRLVPGLLSGTQGVWPPLDPNAKPLPRLGAQQTADVPGDGDVAPRPGDTPPARAGDGAAAGSAGHGPDTVAGDHDTAAPVAGDVAEPVDDGRATVVAAEPATRRPDAGDPEVPGDQVVARAPEVAAHDETAAPGDGVRAASEHDQAAAHDDGIASGPEPPARDETAPDHPDTPVTERRTRTGRRRRPAADESQTVSRLTGPVDAEHEPAPEVTPRPAPEPEAAPSQAAHGDDAEHEARHGDEVGREAAQGGDAGREVVRAEHAGREAARGDDAGREVVRAEHAGREVARGDDAGREAWHGDDVGREVARAERAGREAARGDEVARDERVGREVAYGDEARPRDGQPGDLVTPVPGPRPGEGRVRRIESVVGRDSGGWRRIAQVVVGGGGVRTDGSEIDEARARAVFGGSRRIVVLGCTGGAGQTTTALMLGHAFAQYRDDRIVAVDANTGGGTLTSKIQPETPETLTSLLSGLDRVSGYLTMRGYTTRTASGLEVISADTDAGAEQRLADRSFFSDHRLGESMRLLDRHYKLAVIDPAAALAARLLPYADQLVLVVPASEEASEAVAMTYEWLDGHGCAELRRRAVMVVNGVSRRSMTDVEQAESVARGRCRAIVRVPWEDDLAPGGAEVVDPGQLRAAGRRAYLALAGVVVAGFAAQSVRPSEEELASDPPGTRIGER